MAAPLIVYATRTWAAMVVEDMDAEMGEPPPPLGPDLPTPPASPSPMPQPPRDHACLAVDSKKRMWLYPTIRNAPRSQSEDAPNRIPTSYPMESTHDCMGKA